MKAFKISVLSTIAAALCVTAGATAAPVAVDYTPVSINLAGTSVKNGAGAAYSINNGSLLAKINLYLGIRGTTLAINNVNGHLAVLDATKTEVADLTAYAYYTNPKDGVTYRVFCEGLPFQTGIAETTSGSVALPNFSVGGTIRSENWFYLYFQDDYAGWYTDYEIDIPSGGIATYAVSLKNGAYKQSFSATVHGDFWDNINGNSGTVSGIMSASGTSAVPSPSYWDPYTIIY